MAPPQYQPPMFRASPFKAMPATFQYGPGLQPPDSPIGITATAGNTQATVTWAAGLTNGGSPVIDYTVTASPGGAQTTVIAPTTTAVVTGLTNGTTYTFSVTARNAYGSSTPAPAPFPQRLRVAANNLVDAQNNDLGVLAGFNVHVAATVVGDNFVWSAQDYLDMAAIGTRLVRHVLHWDVFEQSAGVIDSTAITALDTAISRARAAGIYTVLSLPHLNVGRQPAWSMTTGQGELADWVAHGQFFTQYIAQRYANELAVVGCDMNEPPSADLNAIQAAYETYIPWWQTYAPQWPLWVSVSAYGNGTPTPHTGTKASLARLAALDVYSRGVIFSWHDYLNTAGTFRNSDGIGTYQDNGAIAPVDQAPGTFTAQFHGWGDNWNYPNDAQSRLDFTSAQAPQVAFVGGNRGFALAINEFGMDNMQSGEPAWVADKTATFHNSGCVTELWWLYSTATLAVDPFAARPGGTWRPSITTWAAQRGQNTATPVGPPPPTPAVNVVQYPLPYWPTSPFRRFFNRSVVAPRGLTDLTIPGATAPQTLVSPAGSISLTIPGVTAALTLAAPSGSVSLTIPGTTGALTLGATSGSVGVTIPGVAGSIALASTAGAVSVTLPGVTAGMALASPAGAVSITIPGTTASEALVAPAGAVGVTIPGVTSGLTFNAPAGSVSTGTDFSATGVTAALTLLAPPGVVAVTLPGAPSAWALAAAIGSVSVTIPGSTAALALAATAGSVALDFAASGVTAGIALASPAGLVAVTLPGSTAALALGSLPGAVAVTIPGVTVGLVLTAFPGAVFTAQIVLIASAPNGAVISSPSVVQLPGTAAIFYLLSFVPDEVPIGEVATFKVQLAGSDGTRPTPTLAPVARVLDASGAVVLANTTMTSSSGIWSVQWTPTTSGPCSVEVRTSYSGNTVASEIPVTVRPRFDPIALAVSDTLVSRM